MLEQVGNSLKFLAFFTASKQGKTGLTVTVDVYNPAGTQIVTGAAAVAVGGGLYSYTLAQGSVTTEGEYLAIFKTTDATVDQQHIPAIWVVGRAGVENLDALISAILLSQVPGTFASGTAGAALGKIGTAQVLTSAPVAQDASINIVQGDDYNAVEGRALDWTDTGGKWPDLTNATIKLTIGSSPQVQVTGSVITPTGANKKVRAELTATQTGGLKAGTYTYDVQATMPTNLRIVTLVIGVLVVVEDVT